MKSNKISILIISLIMLLICINPSKYIKSASDGMLVFALNVIPSLFPFMFFSKLLTGLQSGNYGKRNILQRLYHKAFAVPETTLCIYFTSLICGYPIGAKLTEESYTKGEISRNDALKLTAFCSNGSSIFIIGTIGIGMLSNFKMGLILYTASVLACFIVGIITAKIIKDKQHTVFKPIPLHIKNIGELLYDTMINSIMSLFIVGGYIILFYVVSDILSAIYATYPLTFVLGKMLETFGLPAHAADGIVFGLFEFTKGCVTVAGYGLPLHICCAICAFLVSFGGISVLFQSITFLSRCKVPVWYYLTVKLLHGILAFCISFFAVLLLC